jgi:hypothetical protein
MTFEDVTLSRPPKAPGKWAGLQAMEINYHGIAARVNSILRLSDPVYGR